MFACSNLVAQKMKTAKEALKRLPFLIAFSHTQLLLTMKAQQNLQIPTAFAIQLTNAQTLISRSPSHSTSIPTHVALLATARANVLIVKMIQVFCIIIHYTSRLLLLLHWTALTRVMTIRKQNFGTT